MSERSKGELSLQEHDGYKIQVCNHSKVKTIWVCPPKSIWTYLITEEVRSQLVYQAARIVGDQLIAEDVVQSSFINAYCKLNNGNLYAVKYQERYLLVRGGKYPMEEKLLTIEDIAFYKDLYKKGKLLKEELNEKIFTFQLQKSRKTADARMINKWLNGEEVNGMEVIEKPFAWMHTIVERNAYKFYKKQKRWQAFAMNSANWSLLEDPHCLNPEQTVLRVERDAEIREFVAALAPHYREILQLRYFQDKEYSFQAIADKLHRPLSTVTSQSARAHQLIRDVIEGKRIVEGGRLVRRKKLA